MKIWALVHPGLEKTCQEEIKELLGVNSTLGVSVVEFEVKKKEDLLFFLRQVQSAQRILFPLARKEKIEGLDFSGFPWKDFVLPDSSLMIDLEHIHGQELRQGIISQVGKTVSQTIEEQCKFLPAFNLKNPGIIILIRFTGKEFLIGIDLAGKELNKRHYRVFPHQASFTGDIAYYLIKEAQFKPGERLLVGLAKDGTLAIEAALFANTLPVHKDILLKFPFLEGVKLESSQKEKTIIYAFDEALPNLMAARKNISLAGVKDFVTIQKLAVDELDVKFAEKEFERIMFQITTKDEDKINEIYYQSSYLLRKGGTLFLITRKKLDLSVPEKFSLVRKDELKRGESVHSLWLLQRR